MLALHFSQQRGAPGPPFTTLLVARLAASSQEKGPYVCQVRPGTFNFVAYAVGHMPPGGQQMSIHDLA